MFESDTRIRATSRPRQYFQSRDKIITMVYDFNEDNKIKEVLALERVGCFLPTAHNIVKITTDYASRLELSYEAIKTYYPTIVRMNPDLRIISDIGYMKYFNREFSDQSDLNLSTYTYIQKCSKIAHGSIRIIFLWPVKNLGNFSSLADITTSPRPDIQYITSKLMLLSDCFLIYSKGQIFPLKSKTMSLI